MKSQRANETLHERADFLSAHNCTATNPLDATRACVWRRLRWRLLDDWAVNHVVQKVRVFFCSARRMQGGL
jgi:hypothetical protein